MSPTHADLPGTLAIAGAWGYIGRKFLDVALARGLATYAYDPGPMPGDLDPGRFIQVAEEADFYRLDAGLFHLALHPEHRRLDLLLARGEPLLILVEKPMALPEHPEACRRVIEAVERSRAIVLYDFPELYDPLTARILDHLAGFEDVRLTEFFVRRSKDREDPANPRNYKRMVPIQYQESVHCLAFVLHVLSAVRGGVAAALADGARLEARSDPYEPPNPEAYPYVVDGRCRFRATLGDARVEGLTDFKGGAEWAKRRVIRGIGDGRPFEIDVSYLEGRKSLRIDGVDQPCEPSSNSYEHVLATATRWARQVGRDGLMAGLYPNPRFTRMTYQLSAALWRSSRDRSELRFDSAADIESWDAGFAREVSLPGRPDREAAR
jgi:predicted dehydrogenase